MPAVLAIQSGIKKLRYATLMGIKKAKTKEIKIITAAESGAESRSRLRHRTHLRSAALQDQPDLHRPS